MSKRSAKERIGKVFAGRYALEELLGQGATGAVYAASDREEGGSACAVKVFHGDAVEPERAQQLLREAERAAAIGHAAVVRVLRSGKDEEDTPYLVMERLEGKTLRAEIEQGTLGIDDVVEIGAQILDGLAATHARKIVHRDVKPSSIFVSRDADGKLHAKLAGFGAIADVESEEMRTLAYISPEEVRGEELDLRSDVWSCGAVLFHAISGKPPFEAQSREALFEKIRDEKPQSLATVKEDAPDWLVRLVDIALSRDPSKRWQHASQMSIGLKNRGEAPLHLDWEGYEDATMRTSSSYEGSAGAGPAATKAADAGGPSIVVDLGGAEPAADPADPPGARPATVPDRLSLPPPDRGGSLWLWIFLVGALAAAAIWYVGRG